MSRKFKEFKVGDILEIKSSNGIFHACNLNKIYDTKVVGSHPYVVRTSKENGIRGYIIENEEALNFSNTISFAQDTAEIFYRDEPYFTGNKIKIMYLKDKSIALNDKLALYLISTLKKGFSTFGWGVSFDTNKLNMVKISLPVINKYIPNLEQLSAKLRGGGTICKVLIPLLGESLN